MRDTIKDFAQSVIVEAKREPGWALMGAGVFLVMISIACALCAIAASIAIRGI